VEYHDNSASVCTDGTNYNNFGNKRCRGKLYSI